MVCEPDGREKKKGRILGCNVNFDEVWLCLLFLCYLYKSTRTGKKKCFGNTGMPLDMQMELIKNIKKR